MLDQLEPLAAAKGITLRANLPAEPVLTVCDQEEIRRVLQNLLDNSLKFTNSGEISVSIEKANSVTTICVKDSGKGVSDEDRSKLFERFWTPTEAGRNYASTGLGLYYCRKVVELHNGKIWCESKIGSGSSFFFTIELPAKPLIPACAPS